MKSKALSLLAFAGTLLLTAACTGDDVADRQPETQNTETGALTTFAVEPDAPKTRTTGDYDGTGIDFYWTEGDRLWVHNSAAAPALQQSARSNIADLLTPSTTPGGIDRTATAKFYFSGTYTEDSYPVRYTGKNSTQGDKVTFKAVQNQPVPNDASHIGESGDCGTAIAHRAGGSYHFTLDHKAAYLTFVPYSTQAEVREAVITQIRVVTNNQAIAGEFSLDDSGIVPSSRPAASMAGLNVYGGTNNRTIALTVNNLPIPSAPDPAANAAIMVLPPGTYQRLDVEYTVRSTVTGQTGIIYKSYNNVTLAAGKNKKVSADLQVTVYNPEYKGDYTADAANYATTATYIYYGGVRSISSGSSHVWDDMAWAAEGHLYSGGVWLKKKAYITKSVGAYADGHFDHSIATRGRINELVKGQISSQKAFFVPAIAGPGSFGVVGRYWIHGVHNVGHYVLAFDRTSIGIGSAVPGTLFQIFKGE